MDISLAAHAQLALQKELHEAYARWMNLCEITAREDGVAAEELQQELDWLRGRRDQLLQHSTPQHLLQIVTNMQNAEAWVRSSLRARIHGLHSLLHVPDVARASAPSTNHFKHALQAGQVQIGLWSALPYVSELIASAGFDWLLLDAVHAPVPIRLQQQLQAVSVGVQGRGRSHAVVRLAREDAQGVQRCLDMGAQTLLLPSVQSAADARAAVNAVHQAQATHSVRDTADTAALDHELCLLVQVETPEALEQLKEIACVEGVDGVFIGPVGVSMGWGCSSEGPRADGMQARVAQALNTIRVCGKAPGILATDQECAQAYLDAGALFVAVGMDIQLLRDGADALVARFKR